MRQLALPNLPKLGLVVLAMSALGIVFIAMSPKSRNQLPTTTPIQPRAHGSRSLQHQRLWTKQQRDDTEVDREFLVQHYKTYTFNELVPLVRVWTMVSEQHLKFSWEAIARINAQGIQGDVVECGVWKGGTSMMMAFAQLKHSTDRHFWLFDTFEGLPYPADEKNGVTAQTIYNELQKGAESDVVKKKMTTRSIESGKWNLGPKHVVKNNLYYTGYPKERIHFIEGTVENTLKDAKRLPKSIAVLRLDTDWYESTKAELEVLYDRLQPGGILIVDDYCHWQGSKAATQEFFKERLGLDSDHILATNKAKGQPCLTYFKP